MGMMEMMNGGNDLGKQLLANLDTGTSILYNERDKRS